MIVGNALGGLIWGLVRGLVLILRDLHRALYHQFHERIWWYYAGAGIVGYLYLTNQLWNFIVYGLYLAIIWFGLRMMISALLRNQRRGGGRR